MAARSYSEEQLQTWAAAYARGQSTMAIALEFATSQGVVNRALRDVLGLQMRPQGHSRRPNGVTQKEHKREYYLAHQAEIGIKIRDYYTANRATLIRKQRDRQILSYGITPEQVEEMRLAQGGRCAICGTDKPGGRGDFHIDHNHKTGMVRALLCNRCNIRLGTIENTDFLQKALSYLEAHK